MLQHQSREKARVDPAEQIMASGDGREGSGVIHESGGVVEAGGLGGGLPESAHAFG